MGQCVTCLKNANIKFKLTFRSLFGKWCCDLLEECEDGQRCQEENDRCQTQPECNEGDCVADLPPCLLLHEDLALELNEGKQMIVEKEGNTVHVRAKIIKSSEKFLWIRLV